MSGRYTDTAEGEWFEVPRHWKLGCCGCGLVHTVETKIRKGKLLMRAWIDRRATSQRQRRKR